MRDTGGRERKINERRVRKGEGEILEHAMLLALMMEDGATRQGMQANSRS